MPGFASSRAVIIGIDAYGNGVPALRSAAKDAQDLATILSADHGYSVAPMFNGNAKLTDLKRQFEEVLPGEVGAEDRVLIYFAGHGIAEDGDDGPTGYLLPQDARADDRASFLRMETFRDWLAKLRCRHLLVILDCCFAGAFRWTKETRHVRSLPEVIHRERYERFIRNPAWQAIASAAYDQEALDAIAGKVLGRRRPAPDNAPNSPFALALFAALKGEADLVPKNGDGVIMAYELATFLRDFVSRCADDARHEQAPCLWSLGKSDGGEYIFLVPGHPLNLPPAPELKAENNPYRGLSAYEENDAGLFFGRDKVVQDLAEVVKKQPLTMVLGASGTGKSSLVRAGLLSYPRKIAQVMVAGGDAEASDALLFRKDPAAGGVFHRLLMRPADAPAAPLRELMKQLSKAGSAADASSEGATDATPTSALSAFSAWFAADAQRHLLLVIDQFEELVTLCNTEVRTGFLHFLADLIDREGARLRVVLTLRSDFEPQFHESALQRHLAGRPSDARFVVPPLRHDELREIIEKPASERVLFFEPPALVDRLVTEVIQMPGALPLLSFALSELYLKYMERQQAAQQKGAIIDRTITEDDYRQLGGVVGALSRRATEEYDACDAAHQATMRRVMLRMVATEGELARRRVPRRELEYLRADETERANAVVERLETARLVVSGRTNAGDAADGEGKYVEPAHDALVRAWGKLLDWQREAAAELPVQRQLTEATAEWTRRNRANGLLWTSDPRLALVSQQLTAPDSCLNARESKFVEASTRRKRRNAQIRGAFIVGLVLLTLASVIGGSWATINQRRATINQIAALRDSAKATFLSNQQLEGMQKGIATGKELAGPLLYLWPDADSENRLNVTMQELVRGAREHNRLPVGKPVAGLAFAPDGRIATRAQFSGKVQLWNRDGTLDPTWPEDTVASSVAFSRDGKIAIALKDKVAFRDMDDGGSWTVLSVDKGQVTSVAFSADGNMIAAATTDENQVGRVQLWHVGDLSPLRLPDDGMGVPMAVAFSPDGGQIAFAHWNGAFLWKTDGTARTELEGHAGSVNAVAFSPDGNRIATAGDDKMVKLWTAEGKPDKTLVGHNDTIWGLDFGPDGRVVASASNDETVKLWQVDGTLLATFSGHGDVVRAVAFSHDGKTLASASDDGTVKLWEPAGTPLKALTHDARVYQVAFSPNGGTVLTTSGHGWVTLWGADGTILNRQKWQYGPITAIAFSPDGKMFATAAGDRTVRLGRIQGGTWVDEGYLEGQTGQTYEVLALSFSPDGKSIAAGGVSQAVQVWDTEDPGRKPKPLIVTQGCVTAIDYSPGDENIVVGSGWGEVQIVSSTNGKLIQKLQEGQTSRNCLTKDRIIEVRYSPDGTTIAAASANNTVKLWTADGTPLKPLSGDQGEVRDVAFSPDGTMIATGSEDGTVRVWKADAPLEETLLAKHNGPVSNVAFSPDGQTVASASEDRTVILSKWQEDLTLDRTLAYACDWMRDYLTNRADAKDVADADAANVKDAWDLCQKVFRSAPVTADAQ